MHGLIANRTISGIPKNSQRETIIGANIVEKGSSNGTITNVDGQFTLRISPNAILKVSYMEYWGEKCNVNRPSYAGSPHASITNNNAWEEYSCIQHNYRKRP